MSASVFRYCALSKGTVSIGIGGVIQAFRPACGGGCGRNDCDLSIRGAMVKKGGVPLSPNIKIHSPEDIETHAIAVLHPSAFVQKSSAPQISAF